MGDDFTGEFVAEDERLGGDEVAATAVGEVVEIAAANAGGAHRHQHLARAGSGAEDYFFANILRAVEHEGGHGRVVACHFLIKVSEGRNRARFELRVTVDLDSRKIEDSKHREEDRVTNGLGGFMRQRNR
jgi:hypothetical protein